VPVLLDDVEVLDVLVVVLVVELFELRARTPAAPAIIITTTMTTMSATLETALIDLLFFHKIMRTSETHSIKKHSYQKPKN